MNCQECREYSEESMSGALFGQAGEHVRTHLAQCAACRKYFEQDEAFHAALVKQLHGTPLPPAVAARLTARLQASATDGRKRIAWPRFGALAAGLTVLLGLAGASWAMSLLWTKPDNAAPAEPPAQDIIEAPLPQPPPNEITPQTNVVEAIPVPEAEPTPPPTDLPIAPTQIETGDNDMNKLQSLAAAITIGAALTQTASGAFSPADIDGCVLWLKADAGVLDATGQPAANGAKVAKWQDYSGQNNHLTQADVNRQPSYVSASANINGSSTILATGNNAATGHFLNFTANPTIQSFFYVGAPAASTAASIIFSYLRLEGGGIAYHTIDAYVGHTGTTGADPVFNVALCGTADGTGNRPLIQAQYALNGAPLSALGRNFYCPNNQLPLPAFLYAQYEAPQTFHYFMRRLNYNRAMSNWHQGEIAEVVAFNRALTEQEQANVGAYLQAKYQLQGEYPVIEAVFINTGAPEIIADTHASFSTKVTGIGEGNTATLRLYYGLTDGGATTAWDYVTETSIEADGTYTLDTQELLDVNVQYFYHFSVEKDNETTFAASSGNFTTAPHATTAGVDNYTGTSARFAADIANVFEGEELTLRIYYGITDGGATTEWAGSAVVDAAVTANGTYYYTLTDAILVPGNTCYYRFSTQAADEPEIFANTSGNFTAAAWETPGTYFWVADMIVSTPMLWSDGNNWTNKENYARQVPGLSGDIVNLINSTRTMKANICITDPVTVKNLYAGYNPAQDYGGSYISILATNESPAKLIFESDSANTPALLQLYTLQNFRVGYNVSAQENLRVRLNTPLEIRKSGNNATAAIFYSAIEGGTAENPSTITCYNNNTDVALLNPGNTFIGDIYVGSTVGSPNLYIGRNSSAGQSGYINVDANDGMFGNPANQIILRRNGQLIIHRNDTLDFTFNRHLLGYGVLRRVWQDNYQNDLANQNRYRGLTLGPDALIAPGEGDEVNQLTITSSKLELDPASTLQFKVGGNNATPRNDKLVLNTTFGTATPTVYTSLALTNTIEFVKLDDVPPKTEFAIITAPVTVTNLTVNFAKKTPQFGFKTTYDEAKGWTIIATYRGEATRLFLY